VTGRLPAAYDSGERPAPARVSDRSRGVLAAGDFRDGDGRRVIRWEVGEGGPARLPRSVEDLEERLQGLETQVSELAERLDFTERLLAQVRERGSLPKG